MKSHEKSDRKNRLDPTLGVRNTDTRILILFAIRGCT